MSLTLSGTRAPLIDDGISSLNLLEGNKTNDKGKVDIHEALCMVNALMHRRELAVQ
jgi:hypothetical protein